LKRALDLQEKLVVGHPTSRHSGASSDAATPASKLLNSREKILVLRAVRSMHFVPETLQLPFDFIFRSTQGPVTDDECADPDEVQMQEMLR